MVAGCQGGLTPKKCSGLRRWLSGGAHKMKPPRGSIGDCEAVCRDSRNLAVKAGAT
jgi:hypothetical protein